MLLLVKLVLHSLHDLLFNLHVKVGIFNFLKHFNDFLVVFFAVMVADNEVWNIKKRKVDFVHDALLFNQSDKVFQNLKVRLESSIDLINYPFKVPALVLRLHLAQLETEIVDSAFLPKQPLVLLLNIVEEADALLNELVLESELAFGLLEQVSDFLVAALVTLLFLQPILG